MLKEQVTGYGETPTFAATKSGMFSADIDAKFVKPKSGDPQRACS
jgi:hypothetical protein